jgi:hypothetical protein
MSVYDTCERCGRAAVFAWCACCHRALCEPCYGQDSTKRIAHAKVRSARAECWWYRGKGDRPTHGHGTPRRA